VLVDAARKPCPADALSSSVTPAAFPRATPDLAGRRGGSGGLPPTIPSLARFCPR